jgi:hypothetical protein
VSSRKLMVMVAASAISVVVAGCGASNDSEQPGGDETTEGELAGAGSASCAATSATPCTPSGELRKFITDVFRLGVHTELANGGARVDERDIVFVYDVFKLQEEHVFVSARIQSSKIMSRDGKKLVLPGSRYDGMPNIVHGLLEIESGSNTTTLIGEPLEATGCWYLTHQNYPESLFPRITSAARCPPR